MTQRIDRPRMRLALVTNFCPHYRIPLYRELMRRYDLTLILTSRGDEWYWEGAVPEAPPDLNAVRAPTAARVVRALRAEKHDAVVVGLTGRASLVAAVLTARALRLPLVLWVGIWAHPETRFHSMSRPLARLLYRRADAILTYGDHVSRYVAAEAGRTEGVFVAPQAAENGRFRTPASEQAIATWRTRLSPSGRPIVLCVGRVVSEKGIDYLIKASAVVRVPHVVVVAGDGPLLGELRDLARSEGTEDSVQFVGRIAQEELPALLQASDVLVVPSVSTPTARETWGFVVNEAMNAGLPVIATEVVGAAAGGLVVSGETGRVVAERDPAALAAAIEELVADAAYRRRLGESAAEHVLAWNFAAAADAFDRAVRFAAG